MSKTYIYKDLKNLAGGLRIFLLFGIFWDIIAIGGDAFEIFVLNGIKNKTFSSQKNMELTANISDLLQGGIGCMQIWLAVVIIILSVIFMYRAAANTWAWGVKNISQTPKWCFWNFILPIWCLFKPYIFLREIYNASEHKSEDDSWKKLPAPTVMKIWWTFFLIENYIGKRLLRAAFKESQSINELIAQSYLHLFDDLLSVITFLTFYRLVGMITKRQRDYQNKLFEAAETL